MRVVTLIASGSSRAVEAGTGKIVGEAAPGARWSVSLAPGAGLRCSLSTEGEGGRWEARTLRIETRDSGTLRVLAGRTEGVYPGTIEIRPGTNSLTVINEAPLELYIQGVVASEVSPRWHPEALKALAVAARSYSERNRGRHGAVFDLCDGTHCHCYRGVARLDPSVRNAVAATAGIVALYDGRPIDAVYSADCGGRTQTGPDAWGRPQETPYLQSVVDAPEGGGPDYCAINPKHAWSVTLPAAELEELLNARPETRVGTLKRVEVIGRSKSGRPTEVELLGGEGEMPLPLDELACERTDGRLARRASRAGPAASPLVVRRLSMDQFRRVIGGAIGIGLAPRGNATRTSLRPTPGRPFGGSMLDLQTLEKGGLRIEAKGSGHGVGLCQYGAQALAARYGKTWQQILHHYYRGIQLGPAP
jgi:stage II sporulation protein D